MDLTIKNSEITNGNPNYSVSYYFSEDDAVNAVNPLSTNYTNILILKQFMLELLI